MTSSCTKQTAASLPTNEKNAFYDIAAADTLFHTLEQCVNPLPPHLKTDTPLNMIPTSAADSVSAVVAPESRNMG